MCIILAPCKPRLPVEGWGGWVPEHSAAWVSGQRDPILSPVARDLDLCSRRVLMPLGLRLAFPLGLWKGICSSSLKHLQRTV